MAIWKERFIVQAIRTLRLIKYIKNVISKSYVWKGQNVVKLGIGKLTNRKSFATNIRTNYRWNRRIIAIRFEIALV